ncbi:hypothetical protein ACFLYO_05895 [Chloroflexota bacterium]
MNNLFFFDSVEAPQPRDEVAITALTVEPYPDGKRIRLQIQITPFLERPNLEIYAQKIDGPVVAELSVIETMTPQLDFTLHIRGLADTAGDYDLIAELFYDDRSTPQNKKKVAFQIQPPDHTQSVD